MTGVTLSQEERDLARAAALRFSRARLSDDELLAEYREAHEAWLLWRGDLEAGDFAWHSPQVLANAMALEELGAADLKRQMERRTRVRIGRADAHASMDWQARFDAMRRVPIVEALGTLGVVLGKHGREWTGPCPFHEDRCPSFSVNADKGLWQCFSCGRAGDLVSFMADTRSLSRVEALFLLEECMPL